MIGYTKAKSEGFTAKKNDVSLIEQRLHALDDQSMSNPDARVLREKIEYLNENPVGFIYDHSPDASASKACEKSS